MKYLIRALKYYLTLLVLLAVIIAAMALIGKAEGSWSQMFRNGYDSIWQMALMVLAIALIYPRFGYGTRSVRINGATDEIWPEVVKFMNDRGYVLTEGDGEGAKFRRASKLSRMSKVWEDTVTFKRELGGYELEGLNRDIVRLDTGLTQRFESAE